MKTLKFIISFALALLIVATLGLTFSVTDKYQLFFLAITLVVASGLFLLINKVIEA